MKKVYFTAAIALLVIGAGGYYMKDYHRDLNGTPSTNITGKTVTNNSGNAGITTPNTEAVAATDNGPCGASTTSIHHGYRIARKQRLYASATNDAIMIDIPQTTVENTLEAPQPEVKPMTPKKEIAYVKRQEFYGHTAKKKNIHIGIEAGLNQSSVYNTASTDYHMAYMLKGGFHAGVVADIRLTDHIAMQPGLRYIQKGEESNSISYGDALNVVAKNKMYTHNVEVPVNVVFKLGELGTTRFLVGGGPYVSYLIDATSKTSAVATTDGSAADAPGTFSVTRNIPADGYLGASGDMRRLDYGVGAFIGAETPGGLYARAGMEAGMRDLQKNNADGQYYNRNYSFLISFGYLLGANK